MKQQSLFEDDPTTIADLKLKCKIIPLNYEDIVFNPLTQILCQNCGMFGRTYRCPPFAMKYYKTKEYLKEFNKFILIVAESDDNEMKERYAHMKEKGFKGWQLEKLVGTQISATNLKKSTDELRQVLRFIRSKSEKFVGYGSAGCIKCKPCEKQNHKPCAHPHDSFSSPEGSGIDLYSILRNKNVKVESPPINRYLAVCMVAWKE